MGEKKKTKPNTSKKMWEIRKQGIKMMENSMKKYLTEVADGNTIPKQASKDRMD